MVERCLYSQSLMFSFLSFIPPRSTLWLTADHNNNIGEEKKGSWCSFTRPDDRVRDTTPE